MSEGTQKDEHEVSDGASDNEYTDHDPDHLGREEEEDEDDEMTETKFNPDTDENCKVFGSTNAAKPKLDPKDPLRPRRKKARRACFACQRAHLTCGDERPCQRCIKRGLADACQDGVRKKAKYLHDAPPEALRPVLGPNYNQLNNQSHHHHHHHHHHPHGNSNGNVNGNRNSSGNTATTTTNADCRTRPRLDGCVTAITTPDVSPNIFYSQAEPSPSYSIFNQPQNSMPPPIQARLSYSSQHSPMSPTYSCHSSVAGLSVAHTPNETQGTFGGPLFDPNNPPGVFNFDLEGLNFGNHYGALEFGMLGHISSGAAGHSPRDTHGSISSQGMAEVSFNGGMYGNNINQYGQVYSGEMMNFAGIPENQMFSAHHGIPHAYAIGSYSHPSPSTEASPAASGVFDSSPSANYNPSSSTTTTTTTTTTTNSNKNTNANSNANAINTNTNTTTTHLANPRPAKPPTGLNGRRGPASIMVGKRSRDPSKIYDTVHEPYSYTTGFHNLTAFIQSRFSASATLKIAKSLASIRPSFISCTKTLNRQDLIFMEKCFQRTLFEYEDLMVNCCTPTLVCRRTGEVAAVNQEFTLMTGWRKDVLLGKEANLNINTGKSMEAGISSRASLITPRMRPHSSVDTRQREGNAQPVFLAEVLDDESVVEFYEDFARLAFNDSRGSVTTKCKVLKYQTKEDKEKSASPEMTKRDDVSGGKKRKYNSDEIGGMGNRVREIDGEYGIGRLQRDGKLDCSYCWTIKRDVFDIPMLVVMNFLPCI